MKPDRLRSPAMLDPAGNRASVGTPPGWGVKREFPVVAGSLRPPKQPALAPTYQPVHVQTGAGGGGGAYAGTARSAANAARAAKPNARSATLPRNSFFI